LAKNLKLNIKNAQIAQAINLGGIKSKLAKKKAGEKAGDEQPKEEPAKEVKGKAAEVAEEPKEEAAPAPRIRARSRSAFAESHDQSNAQSTTQPAASHETSSQVEEELPTSTGEEETPKKATKARSKKKSEEGEEEVGSATIDESPTTEAQEPTPAPAEETPAVRHVLRDRRAREGSFTPSVQPIFHAPRDKLGPTGKHIKDLLPPPKPPAKEERTVEAREKGAAAPAGAGVKGRPGFPAEPAAGEEEGWKGGKGSPSVKAKEFRDLKPVRKTEAQRAFDARDRQGLRDTQSEDEHGWRRKRRGKAQARPVEETIRPSSLTIRLPISIKDLASEMKLKASELIAKLFLQGTVVTLNDILDDETIIQLLGQEFGCEITIDTSKEERIRITDKTIKEEVAATDPEKLVVRAPVVAFMGHVDHGKTSLIDAIRNSNRAAGEAGAITQHIGAFRCHTDVGDIAILDTPGHEAFSSMRARGADVTDIVVLVVAGDEGIRQQTLEAIQHAKAAKVTIVVAINKSDKPNYNADNVYRQLSEIELLPEVWGGQTITVNCSAVSGQGIKELLEMLALQAEVLELKADPTGRARGSVLESEMHKGLGAVATVLVQNGTLTHGDAIVFGHLWGRVKTMHNEYGLELESAGPSTPVEITGLSALPEAGQEFIVVKNEKEAREIAEARMLGFRQTNLQTSKRQSMESLFQQASETSKKVLNVVLRADVQGSLEALKVVLMKIESQKVILNIIFAGVGEVSESDVQLAAASKAVIVGFHTQIESHAEMLVKQMGVVVRLHDIIYHAVDDVKVLMGGLLDKLAQENEKGKALVKATFKSSHHGVIAGCQVIEGTITRNNYIRVMREGKEIWKGTISSLKRVKEDVREVTKGLECGILLNNYNELMENDILEAYDITYITQEL
jgi:translation initiation factor IF-2